MVVTATTSLRSDLHDLFCFAYCLECNTRVIHGFSERFLDVSVTSRTYGFSTVQRMLKVGRADNHGIKILHRVQLIVVDARFDIMTDLFLDFGISLFALILPDIRNCDHVEVQLFIMMQKAGKQGTAEAIGVTHNADIHAIVRAKYASVTLWTKRHRTEGGSGSGLDKISP